MKRSFNYKIRKVHRYLGLFIGVQFLLWTVGGLYFSWSNMDEIHGDTYRNPSPRLAANQDLVSPQLSINQLKKQEIPDSLVSVRLLNILNQPVYQIIYVHQMQDRVHRQVALADAQTGRLRPPLTKPEAIEMAQNAFAPNNAVKKITYITQKNVHAHHEYRGRPLPAWAIQFAHKSKTTVYISAEMGRIETFRNENWRIFDFLWMLHTMDYQSRDHIGNYVLRGFSILGLFTIFSGFLLYYYTSPTLRKLKKR